MLFINAITTEEMNMNPEDAFIMAEENGDISLADYQARKGLADRVTMAIMNANPQYLRQLRETLDNYTGDIGDGLLTIIATKISNMIDTSPFGEIPSLKALAEGFGVFEIVRENIMARNQEMANEILTHDTRWLEDNYHTLVVGDWFPAPIYEAIYQVLAREITNVTSNTGLERLVELAKSWRLFKRVRGDVNARIVSISRDGLIAKKGPHSKLVFNLKTADIMRGDGYTIADFR